MFKKTLSVFFLSIFYFISIGYCVPINSYTPDSPWIINPEGDRVSKVDPDGAIRVREQDQTTPALITPMLMALESTTLSLPIVKNTYTCEITDATSININDLFRVIDPTNNRFYQGTILNLVGTTVTADAPFDFAYPAGVEFATGQLNMAVDGSVTPKIFSLRIGQTSIPAVADITRMIMIAECDSAVDLNKFGNLAPLTRGIMFRQDNGITQNIFTVRSNRGLAGVAFDWVPYLASNPSQGIDGFGWRLTFNGQSKLGVVLRVGQDDNLELWVQDDLTGLVSLTVVLEGHAVN